MAEKSSQDSFVRVRLETSGLPDEAVAQINQALQKTLVSQLADLSVMRGGRIDLGLPADDRFRELFPEIGPTDGIVAQFPILDR